MEKIKIQIELPEEFYSMLAGIVDQKIKEAMTSIAAAKGEDLLSRSEVMKQLRVSRSTLHRWAVSGQLIPLKAGRRPMYSRDQIRKFLSES